MTLVNCPSKSRTESRKRKRHKRNGFWASINTARRNTYKNISSNLNSSHPAPAIPFPFPWSHLARPEYWWALPKPIVCWMRSVFWKQFPGNWIFTRWAANEEAIYVTVRGNKTAAAVALHFVTFTKKALGLWPTSSSAGLALLVSNAAIMVAVLSSFILAITASH